MTSHIRREDANRLVEIPDLNPLRHLWNEMKWQWAWLSGISVRQQRDSEVKLHTQSLQEGVADMETDQ